MKCSPIRPTSTVGIPDVAVIAPTGVLDSKGKEIKSRWLVLEAKDEPETFLNESSRRDTFAEKSKYIDLDTAWLRWLTPLASCCALSRLARPDYDASCDIVLRWGGLTEEAFKERFVEISAAHAGTNRRLQAFRDDQRHPIAEIKLSYPGKLLSHRQEECLERARNEFYLAMRTLRTSPGGVPSGAGWRGGQSPGSLGDFSRISAKPTVFANSISSRFGWRARKSMTGPPSSSISKMFMRSPKSLSGISRRQGLVALLAAVSRAGFPSWTKRNACLPLSTSWRRKAPASCWLAAWCSGL